MQPPGRQYVVWGSSTGWLVFFGAITFGWRCRGVEILPCLHEEACRLAAELQLQGVPCRDVLKQLGRRPTGLHDREALPFRLACDRPIQAWAAPLPHTPPPPPPIAGVEFLCKDFVTTSDVHLAGVVVLTNQCWDRELTQKASVSPAASALVLLIAFFAAHCHLADACLPRGSRGHNTRSLAWPPLWPSSTYPLRAGAAPFLCAHTGRGEAGGRAARGHRGGRLCRRCIGLRGFRGGGRGAGANLLGARAALPRVPEEGAGGRCGRRLRHRGRGGRWGWGCRRVLQGLSA